LSGVRKNKTEQTNKQTKTKRNNKGETENRMRVAEMESGTEIESIKIRCEEAKQMRIGWDGMG